MEAICSPKHRYKVPEDIYNRLRVFENRELRKIFGPKRNEGMPGWRKLNSSPSIIRIIKWRRMKGAGHG
jgi:hypothetical protein